MFGFFKRNPKPTSQPQREAAADTPPVARPDAPANVQFVPMQMAFVAAPATPEQMRDRAARMNRVESVNAITQAVHVVHQYEPTLAKPLVGDDGKCPACHVCVDLLDRVRGNRPKATWQPSEDDVRLIYAAYKRWLLETVAINAPGV